MLGLQLQCNLGNEVTEDAANNIGQLGWTSAFGWERLQLRQLEWRRVAAPWWTTTC